MNNPLVPRPDGADRGSLPRPPTLQTKTAPGIVGGCGGVPAHIVSDLAGGRNLTLPKLCKEFPRKIWQGEVILGSPGGRGAGGGRRVLSPRRATLGGSFSSRKRGMSRLDPAPPWC